MPLADTVIWARNSIRIGADARPQHGSRQINCMRLRGPETCTLCERPAPQSQGLQLPMRNESEKSPSGVKSIARYRTPLMVIFVDKRVRRARNVDKALMLRKQRDFHCRHERIERSCSQPVAQLIMRPPHRRGVVPGLSRGCPRMPALPNLPKLMGTLAIVCPKWLEQRWFKPAGC